MSRANRNASGCIDNTAYEALRNIDREEQKRLNKINKIRRKEKQKSNQNLKFI